MSDIKTYNIGRNPETEYVTLADHKAKLAKARHTTMLLGDENNDLKAEVEQLTIELESMTKYRDEWRDRFRVRSELKGGGGE